MRKRVGVSQSVWCIQCSRHWVGISLGVMVGVAWQALPPWDGRERTSVVDVDASHPWDGIHGKHGFPRSRASGTGDQPGLLSVVVLRLDRVGTGIDSIDREIALRVVL